ASESDAKAKIRSLVAAEQRLLSANPTEGYACNLDALDQRFDAPARRYAPDRPVGGVNGGGTTALAGDYAFTLFCSNEAGPKTAFKLWATSQQEGPGRFVYCIEAGGPLRVAARHR